MELPDQHHPVATRVPSGAAHVLSFDMELWTQDGLRYVVIGDAGPAAIEELSRLIRASR